MSHADYLRGQTDATLHNFIFRPDSGATFANFGEKERKEFRANLRAKDAVIVTLRNC